MVWRFWIRLGKSVRRLAASSAGPKLSKEPESTTAFRESVTLAFAQEVANSAAFTALSWFATALPDRGRTGASSD